MEKYLHLVPWPIFVSLTDQLRTFAPMEVPLKFDTVKSGWSIINIEGSRVTIFFYNILYFCL